MESIENWLESESELESHMDWNCASLSQSLLLQVRFGPKKITANITKNRIFSPVCVLPTDVRIITCLLNINLLENDF